MATIGPVERIKEEVTCPVNFTLLTDAVRLDPCGHVISEVAINQLNTMNKTTCPICRSEITRHFTDRTIRNISEIIQQQNGEATTSEDRSSSKKWGTHGLRQWLRSETKAVVKVRLSKS